ncbi:hypothetical protein KC330_g7566 [Hortaea werneckii]|nr:hypothetical protein KC330_g7566 [Hortaea werneckii]
MIHSHNKQSYEQMANTRFSDPDYDAIDLLKGLGCNKHTIQYYATQLYGNDAGELYADSTEVAALNEISKLSTTEEGRIIAPVLKRSIKQQVMAIHPIQTQQDSTNPRTQALDTEQNDSDQKNQATKTSVSARPSTASSENSVASSPETRSRNNSAETSSTEDHLSNDSDADASAQILESVMQILSSPGREYPEKVTGDWAELELTMQESVRRDSETSVWTFEF